MRFTSTARPWNSLRLWSRIGARYTLLTDSLIRCPREHILVSNESSNKSSLDLSRQKRSNLLNIREVKQWLYMAPKQCSSKNHLRARTNSTLTVHLSPFNNSVNIILRILFFFSDRNEGIIRVFITSYVWTRGKPRCRDAAFGRYYNLFVCTCPCESYRVAQVQAQ